MSGPLAVLGNPASTANRRGRALHLPEGAVRATPQGTAALLRTLADWRAAGIGTLAIDGGDGTVREALSALGTVFGDAPPRVALLPRGNTNLFARKIGGWAGADALLRLAAGAGVERRQRLLSVTGLAAGARCGLILGLGAYAQATAAAEGRRAGGAWQVARAVAGTLLGLALRPSRRQGVPLTLTVERRTTAEGRRLLLLATTAEGALMPGIAPFWGEGAGPVRWLDVLAPGRRLALAAPFALAGRPRRWMAGAGYRSGRAERLEIATRAPVVLDGEPFEPDAHGRIAVGWVEGPRFVVPGGEADP